ncbi:MAG: PhnA-like protein [Rhodospirillaceae bacterium]|nr:PhnA-like protein [Rhodospirillaceae bacterium]
MIDEPITPRSAGDSDAPHLSPVTPMEDVRTVLINRVSWGAVLAGILMSLITQVILTLLGAGIGIASLSPVSAENPDSGSVSIGAAVWWIVSGIIAAAVGGHTAGRLSGRPKESTAGWHGLAAWAGSSLIVLLVLGTALGAAVGGAYNAALAARGGQSGAAGGLMGSVARATGDTAAPQGGMQPGQTADQGAAPAQGSAPAAAAEQPDRQTAEDAISAASTAALVGAIALLLGAVAAWFAGRAGAVEPTLTGIGLAGPRRTAP